MSEGRERVIVHVYDLSNGLAKQLSQSLFGKVFDAVYHTGVVVYGREYSFGMGIESEPLGCSRYGIPIEKLDFGYTEVPKDLFDQFLEDISPKYTIHTYNLMKNNCNNFSDEVVEFLVGDRIPAKILNLPNEVMSTPFGAALVPFLEQMNPATRAPIQPPIPQEPLRFPSQVKSKVEVVIPASSKEESTSSIKREAVVESTPPDSQIKSKKKALEAELRDEFNKIIASGTLTANEAAIQALKNVRGRYKVPA